MINDILAFGTPGAIEVVIILVVLGIPVVLVILFVRHVLQSNKERRRLRLELGKLADELEQARKKKKTNEENDSPAQSG